MADTQPLGKRLLAAAPDDDARFARLLVVAGVGSAALVGGWTATQVAGLWVPAAVAVSLVTVPAILAAIVVTAPG